MGGYSNPFDQPLTSEVQESAQRQQDSVKASPSGNPFDEPLASEVAEQKHKDAVKADPDAAASNTRQMLVSGLTGMPTPNMTDADKASFARGKAAGAGSATAISSAPLLDMLGTTYGSAAVEAVKAAAASHPLVAKLLGHALETATGLTMAKYMHIFDGKH